jgi:protein ImuB
MPLAEALAIQPNLIVEEENPQRDREALQQLAHWAERFSPIVGLEESATPESLLLDITGCEAYFRGEDRLLERVSKELKERGWHARPAIADTVGAAWALAHCAKTPCRATSPPSPDRRGGLGGEVLRPLPLAALRLPAEAIDQLAELGIKRVGELLALPRAGIPARLGPLVLERLDQAVGRAPEVVMPHRLIPEVNAFHAFPHSTDRLHLLKRVLDHLIERIHVRLQEWNWGARQVECRLYPEQGQPLVITVGLVRASRSPRHLGMLLHARLEQARHHEPICAMGLCVPLTESLADAQAELFDGDNSQEDLAKLVDQLSNRLGAEAVTRAVLVPDPQPEYACRFESVGALERGRVRELKSSRAPTLQLSHSPTLSRSHALRPLRLWLRPAAIQALAIVPEGPPYQFTWNRMEYRIERAWGPERIETGWWRGRDVQRDYYQVATHTGSRFWLFRRCHDGRWFLHGCFD